MNTRYEVIVVKRLALVVLVCCVYRVSDGGECRLAKARQKSRQFVVDSTADFAIPVATVVIVSPPVLLYSYRAAAKYATTSPAPQVGVAPSTLAVSADQILRTNCMKCHQGDAAKSGLPFFAMSGDLITPLPRRAILDAASPNADGVTHMPPGEAKKLTAEELDVLRAWAEPPRDLKY
jgi:uncharacterized membrane protein